MAKDGASNDQKQSATTKCPKKITEHVRRLRELNRLYEESGK